MDLVIKEVIDRKELIQEMIWDNIELFSRAFATNCLFIELMDLNPISPLAPNYDDESEDLDEALAEIAKYGKMMDTHKRRIEVLLRELQAC